MNMLRFAIIGCGAISDWHARSILALDGLELVGASDVFRPSLERFTQKYGIRAYDSAEQLLADPSVDAVCICTPSGYHAKFAVDAANAGKHVLVEKPMALTREQCDEVIAAAERAGVKLAVVSQNRTSDTVRYVKNAIEAGRFGRIVCGDVYMKFFRSNAYYESGSWRGTWKLDGGGALMNQGIHGVDILQYLCGPVRSVFARAATLVRNIETEDTLSAVLTFESGALGVIQATTSVYPGYPRRIEINGTRGSVRLQDSEIADWQVEGEGLPVGGLPVSRITGSTASDPTAALSLEGHKQQIRDFADAILENRSPMVDGYEGRKPVDIILAAYESQKTGKEVFLK